MNYEQLLKDALAEMGDDVSTNLNMLVEAIAFEGARLAGAAAEPGFDMVLRASRDNVALLAGIHSVKVANAAESRLLGMIQTILLGIATS